MEGVSNETCHGGRVERDEERLKREKRRGVERREEKRIIEKDKMHGM